MIIISPHTHTYSWVRTRCPKWTALHRVRQLKEDAYLKGITWKRNAKCRFKRNLNYVLYSRPHKNTYLPTPVPFFFFLFLVCISKRNPPCWWNLEFPKRQYETKKHSFIFILQKERPTMNIHSFFIQPAQRRK